VLFFKSSTCLPLSFQVNLCMNPLSSPPTLMYISRLTCIPSTLISSQVGVKAGRSWWRALVEKKVRKIHDHSWRFLDDKEEERDLHSLEALFDSMWMESNIFFP
jgi:hypothetical protein